MNQNTDILHEAKRLRLLAAALELQHYTCTAANVVPIPGGDRVIAIGTLEQVAQLLPVAERAPEAGELPAILFDGHAVYCEVMAGDPNTPRPTADNVADVLDAVVRLARRAQAAQGITAPLSQFANGEHAEQIGQDERALPPLPNPLLSTRHGTPCYSVGQMMDYARAAIAHAAAICEGIAAKSKNSLFRSGAKICAGEIRAEQADQADSEGDHHD